MKEHPEILSGGFSIHISFSKRTVEIFKRNIDWLKIEVGNSIHSQEKVIPR